MLKIERNQDSIFIAKDKFKSPVILENIGDQFIYDFQIDNIKRISNFKSEVTKLTNFRNIKISWQIKWEDKCSDWFPITGFDINSPEFDNHENYTIYIKWERIGDDETGNIYIHDFKIEGIWWRPTLTNPYVKLTSENFNVPVIIKPEDVFKVFNLTDVEILTDPMTDEKGSKIQFRVSQDNWKTSTPWEDLNRENISTVMKEHKLTPIRFFRIEYKINRIGTDTTGTFNVYDINLIGEFQNVSNNAQKTNLIGIRECCQDKNTTFTNFNFGVPDSDSLPENLANPISDDIVRNLWDPYHLGKAIELHNSLAESTNEMFGHRVTYFLTDPNRGGTDYTFHENQLYDVVCEEDIKVSVNENQFPDNQIQFNQFDLSLFETFEVHIPKKQFKRVFGVEKRPSKEDFLWFCQLNRMYQVEHAQPFRDFNNSSVYYRVILKKFNRKSSVQGQSETMQSRIDELTKNSDLDQLFNLQKEQDKKEIANKDQRSTLSKDRVRYEFSAQIKKELIENATLVINKQYYDLSSISPTSVGVRYKLADNMLEKGNNRSFSFWFRIPEYVSNENYNFINNYQDGKGYKINLYDDKFELTINDIQSQMPIEILDNIWYCYTVNINQRQNRIEHYLYKRNVTDEQRARFLKSSKLLLVEKMIDENIPSQQFDFENDIFIFGSNMELTNIRIYNTPIPEDRHTKILNQNILKNSEHLILADNSNDKVILPNYPYN